MEQLQTTESYELRIQHFRKRSKELDNARLTDKAMEYSAEVASYDTMLADLGQHEQHLRGMIPANTITHNIAVTHYNGLYGALDNARNDADAKRKEYVKLLALAENYRHAIPRLEAEIAKRKEQENRLRGGIVGTIARVLFGATKVDPSAELPYIIDCLRLREDANATLRNKVQRQRQEKWEQAASDLQTWIEDNEVSTYATQRIIYRLGDSGYHYDTTVIHRTVEDIRPIEGSDTMQYAWAKDTAARLIQIPFDPNEVSSRLLKGKAANTGATMGDVIHEVYISIDPATETIKPVIHVQRLDNGQALRTRGGIVMG